MKKKYKLKLSLILLLIYMVNITTITRIEAKMSSGELVKITQVGQVIDSITYNGKQIDAIYTTALNMGSDPTYSCAAFVKKFYKEVYGITVYYLLGPTYKPQVSGGPGSFALTDTPQVGDIIRDNTRTHWAIVKAVSGDTITVIHQNYRNGASAWKNNVIMLSDKDYSYFTYSERIPEINEPTPTGEALPTNMPSPVITPGITPAPGNNSDVTITPVPGNASGVTVTPPIITPVPTITVTPNVSVTPTITVSPTKSVTPTQSVIPTQSVTPAPTITVAPTQSANPSPTVTNNPTGSTIPQPTQTPASNQNSNQGMDHISGQKLIDIFQGSLNAFTTEGYHFFELKSGGNTQIQLKFHGNRPDVSKMTLYKNETSGEIIEVKSLSADKNSDLTLESTILSAGNYYVKLEAYFYTTMNANATYTMTVNSDGKDNPTNLKLKKATTSSIAIAWDGMNNVNSYEVYRSGKKTSGYKKVATVSSPGFTDKKVETKTTYYYKIRAVVQKEQVTSYSSVLKVKSK
ncbi:MAG: Bacterial surface protein [Herbinix sp.]|jgi:hypothetical protein|nr:Bacterial surface protein [Herbinix sp.]